MNWFTVIWLTLGTIGGITEIVALARKERHDTLSEHVWAWWHVYDRRPTPLVVVGRVVLLTIMVWLTGHFAFGWWTL